MGFQYKLKMFMPSRFAQWKLYFHTIKQAEQKADRSGKEVEGKADLVTSSGSVAALHCLLLTTLQKEAYPFPWCYMLQNLPDTMPVNLNFAAGLILFS